MLLVPLRRHPLWWLAPPPFPRLCRGHYGRWTFQATGVYGCSGGKTIQPGLRPVEMHPYSCFAGLLLKGSMSLDFRVAALPYKSSSFATPEGEVCSTLTFALTQDAHYIAAVKVPPPGERWCISTKRGVFPSRQRRGWPVFPSPVRAALWFYQLTSSPAHQFTSPLPWFYQKWRRRRPPQPSGQRPVKPKNLKNLRARRARPPFSSAPSALYTPFHFML